MLRAGYLAADLGGGEAGMTVALVIMFLVALVLLMAVILGDEDDE